MLWNTARQWEVFLVMAVAGSLAGLYYDLLWAVRIRLEAGFWLALIADLTFGAGAAALFILFSMQACYGQVRLYELTAFVLGMAAYMGGPHVLLRRAAGKLGRGIRWLQNRTWLQKIFR